MHRTWKPAVAVLLLCGNAIAQGTVIPITKRGAIKSGIDLSGLVCTGTRPAAFKTVLQDDLMRSGWFKVATGRDAAIKAHGSCTDDGTGLIARVRVLNVATGRTSLDKSFKHSAGNYLKLAHECADAIVMAVKGVSGIASSRIVMVGGTGSAKELYVCDADGRNMVQLTRDGSISAFPDWDPLGDTVVYTSFRTAFPYVYSIDLGSKPYSRKRLTDYPGLNLGATVSPDGKLVALSLSKDGNPDIYTFRIGARKPPVRLTRTGTAAEASPSWSPDGRSIAYVSDSSGRPNIYIASANGAATRRITFRGTENVAPDWGENGLIAFSSRRGGRYHVFTINPKTGKEAQVTSDAADYEDPSWAPDGRHITCTRTHAYRSTVYILDTLGDPPIRLVHEKGDWHSPAWSP